MARAQGGCLLGDLDREAQLHGLAAVLGFVSNTGIAGLTLGGGFGYLSRRDGWASDNLISVEVVTADGQIVCASEREHADLFWGVRGGGSNFGIVASFEYRLHPVGPEIDGGAIAWRAEESDAVFDAYLQFIRDAPPELSVVPVMRNAPPAPWINREAHGKPILALFVCHSGSGGRRRAPDGARQEDRIAGRRRRAAPHSVAAEDPRRDAAEWTALLLEVGIPAGDHDGGVRQATRACVSGVAALRGS